MKAFFGLFFAGLLAFGQTAAIDQQDLEIEPYGIVEEIIKAILEGLRPKLANLTIPDIEEQVVNPLINATFIARNITIKNADKFVITKLKSDLIPLRLANLTLNLDSIDASAFYDVNATVALQKLAEPVKIFGKGKARALLNGIRFTIGANLEMKNNKYIQIKPKGLFGFDISLRSANITLESIMGSPEFGNAIGAFISKALPGLIDDLKKPVFDSCQDQIIVFLNNFLKGNKTFLMDDESMESNESEEFLPLENFKFNGEEMEVDDDMYENEELLKHF